MLRQNQSIDTSETDNLPPASPPASPTQTDLEQHTEMTDYSKSKIIQLNCFNRHDTVQEILNLNDIDILILQETWTNPFNFRIMFHHMWHDVTPYDHVPQDAQSKFRTCIYISKRYPLKNICILPSRSTYITAVDLKTDYSGIPRLKVMSFYNRPSTNEGLPLLKQWLDQFGDRHIPTIIGMDANLHHPQWNPQPRRNTHPLARDLIKTCGTAGFKIISEKGVPTFYPRQNGKPSTIDLTWGNWLMAKYNPVCRTLTDTYGSDHQAL